VAQSNTAAAKPATTTSAEPDRFRIKCFQTVSEQELPRASGVYSQLAQHVSMCGGGAEANGEVDRRNNSSPTRNGFYHYYLFILNATREYQIEMDLESCKHADSVERRKKRERQREEERETDRERETERERERAEIQPRIPNLRGKTSKSQTNET
jgi:hypothetical protein